MTLAVLHPTVPRCDVPTAMVVLRLVHRPGLVIARCRHIVVTAVITRCRCVLPGGVATVVMVVTAVHSTFHALFDSAGYVAKSEGCDSLAVIVVGLHWSGGEEGSCCDNHGEELIHLRNLRSSGSVGVLTAKIIAHKSHFVNTIIALS